MFGLLPQRRLRVTPRHGDTLRMFVCGDLLMHEVRDVPRDIRRRYRATLCPATASKAPRCGKIRKTTSSSTAVASHRGASQRGRRHPAPGQLPGAARPPVPGLA